MNAMTDQSANLTHKNPNIFEAEQQVINDITLALQEMKKVVTNKDLILLLVAHMETETDIIRKGILRNALEMAVHRALMMCSAYSLTA